jgi:anaerobic selenocysteine-containing dehydrogenase
MSRVSRRDFLKGVALAATATALGCSDQPATKIIPSIIQPEDIVPGEATWYATTCRECPAGCGMLAKTRDGHVIKVEGNPLHPVNGGEWWGKLCPRGQASVQGLYNPDRFPGPMRKRAQGGLAPVSWEEGEKIFLERLLPLAQKGRGERIAFISGLISGTQKELLDHWMESLGAGTLLLYEAYAYEALRKANEIVFGRDAIPTYHVERSDFLISFGANFLETWLSNIQYTRQFAAFHGAKGEKKNFFVFVGPRLSLTAANADQWISVSPGKEYLVALGLLRAILEENPPSLAGERKSLLYSRVKDFPLSALESHTGVKEETFRVLARKFTRAGNPLVVAEGLYYSDPRALETAVAANLLCTLSPGTEQTIPPPWARLSGPRR